MNENWYQEVLEVFSKTPGISSTEVQKAFPKIPPWRIALVERASSNTMKVYMYVHKTQVCFGKIIDGYEVQQYTYWKDVCWSDPYADLYFQ